MMNILILLIALITFIFLKKRFGVLSFLGAGYFGLLIYSIPVFINKARYFYYLSSDFYLYEPSFEAMLVYLIVWTTFFLFVIFKVDVSKYKNYYYDRSEKIISKEFLWACAFLSICFFIYLINSTQSETFILLIGRWVIVLSILSALVYRSKKLFIFLFCILIFWFLNGDRTLLGIALMSTAPIYMQHKYHSTNLFYHQIFSINNFLVLIGVVFVIVFGKNIYTSINTGNMYILYNVFELNNITEFLSKSFEPMIIFNHIQHVIDNSVEISVFDFLLSIFVNFLVYPSYFGFSSNLYNQVLVDSLIIEMSYGVAGNYWAHAYSVFGYIGVCIFAFIYVNFLYYCDNFYLSKKGSSVILMAALGGLVALYSHRNGLDNLLSFVRQIMLAYFLIVLTSFIVRICTLSCNFFTKKKIL